MYAGKALRFTRVGKETGIAHPCKTRRENMLKETKDKLYSVKWLPADVTLIAEIEKHMI